MRLLALVIAFASLTAVACPDLSGEFSVCRSKNNISIEGADLKVDYLTSEGMKYYKFDYLPDGYSERSVERYEVSGRTVHQSWTTETGAVFESKVSAKCMGNKLYVNSVVMKDGENFKSDLTVIRKVGNSLIMDSQGTIGSLAFKDTLTCQ